MANEPTPAQTFAEGYWPKGLSPAKRAFIGAYIETCSISEASVVAGVSRRVHYEWLASDPVYRDEWLACKPVVAERLEDEAVRRGFKGILKPVTIAGAREEVVEYSDMLLKMLLMAANPDRFKLKVEQTNLQDLDPSKLTPEVLDKLAEHLIAKALGNDPAVVAEAKRRLEAGETVTVDTTFEVDSKTEGDS